MVWLYDGEKNSMIYLLVSTKYTNVTDRQADRRTPHDGIGRAFPQHCAAEKLISHVNEFFFLGGGQPR